MKTITICGSLKYQKEMMVLSEKLSMQGNLVLTPIYPMSNNYTEEEIKILKLMHLERIKLSDAIMVVNINNYIGESTSKEIEYAKSLNKEVLYYTDII